MKDLILAHGSTYSTDSSQSSLNNVQLILPSVKDIQGEIQQNIKTVRNTRTFVAVKRNAVLV
jgi:hypothetical protein